MAKPSISRCSQPLKVLDLFSGIGGFSYAAESLVGGFKTTQFVEIDPYCQSVLRKNFPNVPIHNDIKTFKATKGQFDIITAGFPCQDLSLAGRMEGLEGERSGLFFEVLRLARESQCKFILFENVRHTLSHQDGETFQKILYSLTNSGFDAVEWSVIQAKDVGACHKRSRLWFVAYASSILKGGAESTLQAGREATTSSTSTDSESNGSDGGKLKERKAKREGQRQLGGGDSPELTYSNSEGSQGLRREHELRESSEEETPCWSPQPHTLSPDWRGYVAKPCLPSGDDGLSNRVARLRAVGNSIVPQVAAVPLARIKQLHTLLY